MAQSLTSGFHKNLANLFVKDIQLLKTNVYYYLGKVSQWNVGDTPPSITLNAATEAAARDNILYMAKVTPNDVSLCAKRYNWTTGTVYARWDDKLVMNNANFFVVNSSNRVYKCLDNNGGAASTVEPSAAEGLSAFRTSDDYVWKYMYTIPAFKQQKFLSSSYIPVQQALTDSFYNQGALEDVNIINGGSGYTTFTFTSITISGSGSGAVLVPMLNSLGQIVDVKIVSGGSGYTTPTLTVVGSGSSYYPENSGGAKLEAVVSSGVIVKVLVKDPGISYTQNTSASIVVTGDGSGASLTPVVYNGSIIDAVINNTGSGYSYMNISVTGTGSGAILTAKLGMADIVSDQSIVEQMSVKGAIYSARITNAGSGYDPLTTPKVTISGDGSGATAIAIMNAGSLQKIKFTSFGSGYSYANITIEAPVGIGSVQATAEAIYGPLNGHGYNAPAELLADTICISSVIKANNTLSEINQDYRQYGLIADPTSFVGSTFTNVTESLLAYKVKMLSTAGLSTDMELTSSYNYKYVVVKYDSTYAYLQPLGSATVAPMGSLSNSGTVWFATDLVSSPTINKYSGEMLSLSAETAFTFTSLQSVALKTFIKC